MNFEDPKDTALEGIRRLRDLIHGAGLPLTLKEAGIDTEKFEEIADLVTNHGTQTCGAFYPMEKEDVLINVPRFGYRVVRMTEKDARDAKQMRMLLETEAKSKMEIFPWIWYAVTKTVQVEPIGGLP